MRKLFSSIYDLNVMLVDSFGFPATVTQHSISDMTSITTAVEKTAFNTPSPAVFELSSLFAVNGGDGSAGFIINGINATDQSGFAVSTAGDINGDGFDDLIIGAPQADPNIRDSGATYIVFGNDAGFAANFELSSLDGTNGFVINGIDRNDKSGSAVSSAGDVNGDGVDDIIIGAWQADPLGLSSAGESYVVFGRTTSFAPSVELSALNGANGFVINGIESGDYSGFSISAAGDMNGDGVDDIIIGAYRADSDGIQNFKGASYVVFGNSSGFTASLDLAALDGTNGFVINGVASTVYSGLAVSTAGDINGDGIDDILIGAPSADPNSNSSAGTSYVVFGSSAGFSAGFELSSLDGSNGFAIHGINSSDQSGRSVNAAGDINGDGFDDLILGARGADPNGADRAGQSYVVFGNDTGFQADFDLSALNGTNGFAINGANELEWSGVSVSAAGDFNGDGFDDLIIGANSANPGGRNAAGQSYVVFGSDAGFSANFNLSALDGINGFSINGINQFDYSGGTVSAAGDINGDGFDDLIIGAYRADPNGNSSGGESYVIFGSSEYGEQSPAPTEGDDILTGTTGDDVIDLLAGNDTYNGMDRDDFVQGNLGNDTLHGGLGDDILDGGFGNDRLYGGGGHDILIGGSGRDILDGGNGIDTVDYSSATNRVNINLLADTASGAQAIGDTLISIENLIGTNFGDDMRGDNSANILNGGGGKDTLIGYNGDDELYGGTGRDILSGGNGADILDGGADIDQARYNGSTAAVQIDLLAGTATGGQAQGDIITNVENIFGSNHNDTLYGDGNNNKLFGHNGDDALAGNGGISKLYGGAGSDSFVLSDGFAFVMDFVDDVDQLDVSDYGFATLADALMNVDQVGNHARFRFDGDVLFVLNTDANDLSDDIVI